jgi:hypothetical protein
MTEAERGEMGTYLGIDAKGIIVAACVDNPEHREDVAEFVSTSVKEGLRLERCKVRDLWEGRVKLYEEYAVFTQRKP